MIPKKIHYCWFGGNPIPEKDKKCIESWKKYCPDYEIIEWNESNYDLNKNQYMAEAYKERKWGFVPDYARFDIIYNHGGFYLDTDVELIASLDILRDNKGYMGFEGGTWINGGIGFGGEAGNETIKGLIDMYDHLSFYQEDGNLNLKPSPYYITEYLVKKGLSRDNREQDVGDLHIYPTDYFAAKDYDTGKVHKTMNTISIHQYNASWKTPKQKLVYKIKRVIGEKNFEKLLEVKKIIIKYRIDIFRINQYNFI